MCIYTGKYPTTVGGVAPVALLLGKATGGRGIARQWVGAPTLAGQVAGVDAPYLPHAPFSSWVLLSSLELSDTLG